MDNKLQKANFGKRMAAFIIDHIVLCVISSIGAPFIIWNIYTHGFDRLWIVFPIYLGIIFFIYSFKDIVGGASIGKRIMKLVVRCCDSTTIPHKRKLFIRNIFSFLWLVELLIILFSKRKTKLGDIIAGTNVYMVK